MNRSHKTFSAPGFGLISKRGLSLVAVFSFAALCRPATPDPVLTDSELISGFELSAVEDAVGPLESAPVLRKGIYWWDGPGKCSGEGLHSGKIWFRGTVTGRSRSLHNSCHILQDAVYNVVQDDQYAYFFIDGQLERKALNAKVGDFAQKLSTSPDDPTLPSELSTFLDLNGSRLYWGKYLPSPGWVLVLRMANDASAPYQTVAAILDAGAPVQKLKAFSYRDSTGTYIDAVAVLLTNGKLYRCNLTAGTTALFATGVCDFAVHTIYAIFGIDSRIYAAVGVPTPIVPAGAPASMLLRINPETAASSIVYSAAGMNQIVSVGTDSDKVENFLGPSVNKNIYLSENVVVSSGGGGSVTDTRIYKQTLPVPGGPWALAVTTAGGGNLRSDDKYFYFLRGATIWRLATDAPPVEIDLQADALEVVQSCQDLNQSARLLANRHTFVRGYAHFTVDTSGLTAPWIPKATLEGYRGTTLLGTISPASPSGGVVSTDGNLDNLRTSLGTSFLFELPDSWVTPGDLRFLMNLNDDAVIPETGTALNFKTAGPVHFGGGRSPVCIFVPILTTAPLYRPENPDSGFTEILRRAGSVLPVDRGVVNWMKQSDKISRDVIVFKTCWCWPPVKLIEERPYSLDTFDEQEEVMTAVWRRAFWSRDPSGYDSVHYVGTVHASHSSTFNGRGENGGHTIVARMQTGPNGPSGRTDPWLLPFGGLNLAHELGHNWGRNHILQLAGCGSQLPAGPYDPPPDSNPCNLSTPTGPTAVYGFDPITETVIAPTAAADLMTYANSTWISGMNWGVLSPPGPASLVNSFDLRPLTNAAGSVLVIQAAIDPTLNQAKLEPCYCLPSGVADTQRVAQSYSAAAQLPPNFPFQIRLLDGAGNVLSRTPCVLVSSSDGEPGNTLHMTQIVPFDPATRVVQLVRDNVGLAERLISEHPPMVSLAAPAVDPVNSTLTLNWNAFDADYDFLLFTIQYSADDGATWIALAADYPYLSKTLSTLALPGSQTARVRVIATDGANCAVASSDPFPLARHSPELQIQGVREGQRLSFGSRSALSAMAYDAEDLSRPTANVTWSLTGPTPLSGTGGTLSLAELSPGSYSAIASVSDFDNNTTNAMLDFEVRPMPIPDGPAPVLDGLAHDGAYSGGTTLRIPLASGQFARASLVHSASNLFVCFTGLELPSSPGTPRTVGIRIDADASGDALGQPGDVGFFVDSDGIPFQEAGSGTNMAVTLSPQPGFTVVVQLGSSGWSAEFQIANNLLGGWNHAAGIMVAHDAAHWPPLADGNQPVTWAPAYFGAVPPLPPNRPPFANAGPRQVINVANSRLVVLDGTASADPDGDPLTFNWTQVSGPTVAITNTGSPSPSFVADPVATPTTLRFRLVVSDASLSSAPDETEVVLLPTPTQNLPDLPLDSQAHFADGAFEFRMQAQPGTRVSVDASSDLVHWQTLYMATADFYGLIDFIDRTATNFPARFYRLSTVPTNDYFASAMPLAGAPISISSANFLATKETGELNHAGNPGGRSLWWSWTAPANGVATISTVGSNFDTVLAVYVGGSIFQLQPIAMDDDSGGNLTSRVMIQVGAGQIYRIAVDGFNGAAGNIQLNISMP